MQKAAPETKKPMSAVVDLGAYRIADPNLVREPVGQLSGDRVG